MNAPRQLSIHPMSPHYDRETADQVDKVFVDGKHLPGCFAYDMDAGWAFAIQKGAWQPKIYGTVTVTMKGGA